MRRPLRSWTIKITLCLLAGGLITWATSWAIAVFDRRPVSLTPISFSLPDGSILWGSHGSNWMRQCWYADVPRGSGGVRDVVIPPAWVRMPPGWDDVSCEASGFPFVALYKREGFSAQTMSILLEDALILPGRVPHDAVPTGVLPVGFTLNTLLAAAVLLGLVQTVGIARSRCRARRGRCPHCNYPRTGLASDAPCPECTVTA